MNSWPSTTQVLHDAGLYGDIAKWSNSEAMRRGRLVDAACNLIAMGKELTDEWCYLHPECGPYVDGYYEFVKLHDVKLIKCAFEVVNNALRYRGHLDQLVMLDGERTLLDIKTGSMPKCCALQLASYEMGLYAMHDPDVADNRVVRCGLQLAAGDFKLHFFSDPTEKDEFSILVQAWHVRRKYVDE